MKRVASIFAVAVMTIGLFASCESETSVNDSDALYDMQVEATDGDYKTTTGRN